MQAIEIGQRHERITTERLEPAAGVARAVAQHRAAHPVGDAGLKLLEAGILAADPLAGNEADARARGHHAQELGDEGGIVLAIAVERDHDRGARMGHAGAHRSRLAAGLHMLDLAQKRRLAIRERSLLRCRRSSHR